MISQPCSVLCCFRTGSDFVNMVPNSTSDVVSLATRQVPHTPQVPFHLFSEIFVLYEFISRKECVDEPVPSWFGVPCLRNDHVFELVVDFIGEVDPIINVHFNKRWCRKDSSGQLGDGQST